MVNYMRVYYDLQSDRNVFSEQRYAQDDLLWDNIAFVIPPLCRQTIRIFNEEPMIVTDIEPNVIIFGDIHGNFNDIHFIYDKFISNPKYLTTKFIFLGDYVDRGPKPVEVVCFLFALKLSDPNRFYLLRGNHEVLKINRKYGFQHMCLYLFGDTYIKHQTLAVLNYKLFNKAFCFMPVGAVIKGTGNGNEEQKIFCCHGGVPSYYITDTLPKQIDILSKPENLHDYNGIKNVEEMPVGWSIDDLNNGLRKPISLYADRKCFPLERAFTEILWNDPASVALRRRMQPPYGNRKFYVNKGRGGHCSFFTEAGLKAFLERNRLKMVIRGHQFDVTERKGTHFDFVKQRLTLASLGSPKTPAYSDLARFAREALVGGRFW
ncbi:hypothetical protein TYRP_023215 [Tyrophagus putrescentiae]|nr:hypothetical protein TYRP_023215 [Tyrophagus putrescentiae]